MEFFITAHVDYVYDELFNEFEEIHRLGNEYVDELFQRVMKMYHIVPKRFKPSYQEIFDWFSYLIFVFEGYNMNNQIISHSQDLDRDDEYLVTSYPREILSNLHTIQSYPQTSDTLQYNFRE
jgi:hypothetical protein